jgi:hypothetical protein
MTPPLHTTVLDTAGLVRLFREVAGRTFLGPVDGFGVLELVFEDDPDGRSGNLVSVICEGPNRGRVTFGFVSSPAEYARAAADS